LLFLLLPKLERSARRYWAHNWVW